MEERIFYLENFPFLLLLFDKQNRAKNSFQFRWPVFSSFREEKSEKMMVFENNF
jgi:hypothetical protein